MRWVLLPVLAVALWPRPLLLAAVLLLLTGPQRTADILIVFAALRVIAWVLAVSRRARG